MLIKRLEPGARMSQADITSACVFTWMNVAFGFDQKRGAYPAWGVYAVILYSGFYDMSAKLIEGFGQDPGPPHNTFSLADAGGTANKETETDKPRPLFGGNGGVPPRGHY